MGYRGKSSPIQNSLLNSEKNDTNKSNLKSAKASMPSWTEYLKVTWKHSEITLTNSRKKGKEPTLNLKPTIRKGSQHTGEICIKPKTNSN